MPCCSVGPGRSGDESTLWWKHLWSASLLPGIPGIAGRNLWHGVKGRQGQALVDHKQMGRGVSVEWLPFRQGGTGANLSITSRMKPHQKIRRETENSTTRTKRTGRVRPARTRRVKLCQTMEETRYDNVPPKPRRARITKRADPNTANQHDAVKQDRLPPTDDAPKSRVQRFAASSTHRWRKWRGSTRRRGSNTRWRRHQLVQQAVGAVVRAGGRRRRIQGPPRGACSASRSRCGWKVNCNLKTRPPKRQLHNRRWAHFFHTYWRKMTSFVSQNQSLMRDFNEIGFPVP